MKYIITIMALFITAATLTADSRKEAIENLLDSIDRKDPDQEVVMFNEVPPGLQNYPIVAGAFRVNHGDWEITNGAEVGHIGERVIRILDYTESIRSVAGLDEHGEHEAMIIIGTTAAVYFFQDSPEDLRREGYQFYLIRVDLRSNALLEMYIQ